MMKFETGVLTVATSLLETLAPAIELVAHAANIAFGWMGDFLTTAKKEMEVRPLYKRMNPEGWGDPGLLPNSLQVIRDMYSPGSVLDPTHGYGQNANALTKLIQANAGLTVQGSDASIGGVLPSTKADQITGGGRRQNIFNFNRGIIEKLEQHITGGMKESVDGFEHAVESALVRILSSVNATG